MDKGFVMGVNMFTDLDSSEIPKGYNKMMHPAWRSQLKSSVTKLTKTERLLGETDTNTDTEAYRVSWLIFCLCFASPTPRVFVLSIDFSPHHAHILLHVFLLCRLIPHSLWSP